SLAVSKLLDHSIARRAIDVTIKDRKKNGDPPARNRSSLGIAIGFNSHNLSIGRADDGSGNLRNLPPGVAEKGQHRRAQQKNRNPNPGPVQIAQDRPNDQQWNNKEQ